MADKKTDALFAKQPIYDSYSNLYGYEILYRDSSDNYATFKNPDSASSQLLVNFCSGVFESINQPYVKIFINLTREMILSDMFFPIPPDRVVIEILENTTVDNELLMRIYELKKQGYIFAVDDYTEDTPHLDKLLSLVDILKIDVLDFAKENIASFVNNITVKFKIGHKPVLLAEKIEDESILAKCQDAGFGLFQGYYLARPEIVYGKKIESNKQNSLRLLSALLKSDVTIDEVTELVTQDVKLAFQLLKIVNSPLCRLPRKVENIHNVIVFLGLKVVKKWAMILALTEQQECSTELMRILLERAKLCELISNRINPYISDSSFTVGLFSGIDLVLKADKMWLLQQIGFSSDIVLAISQQQGELGNILELALATENAEFEKLSKLNEKESEAVYIASIEASRWVSEILKTTQ